MHCVDAITRAAVGPRPAQSRQGDAIRFHPTLIAFAGHYRYDPRPVAVARGNKKGRLLILRRPNAGTLQGKLMTVAHVDDAAAPAFSGPSLARAQKGSSPDNTALLRRGDRSANNRSLPEPLLPLVSGDSQTWPGGAHPRPAFHVRHQTERPTFSVKGALSC
jgi:hypothetical protein